MTNIYFSLNLNITNRLLRKANSLPANSLNIQTTPENIIGAKFKILSESLPETGRNSFIDARLYNSSAWRDIGQGYLTTDNGFATLLDAEALGLEDGKTYAVLAQAVDENSTSDTFYPNPAPGKSPTEWLTQLGTLVDLEIGVLCAHYNCPG